MEKVYQPQAVEARWREVWEKNQTYWSVPDERPPYTILMPPPNVTGVLHMGHVLNNTIQDILARHYRMRGYNVCWVPGTDHASIATEAKVVAALKARGASKHSLGREDFLREAWVWTEKHGGIITQQLRSLGVSADWSRYRFTLDPPLYRAVIRSFVRLYRDGLIYRGKRMIHWDPAALTALSDEEVIYKPHQGTLYYVRYHGEGGDYLVVATVRPETILADTAVAVHPADERYRAWIGRRVRVPLTDRWVPVIADEVVDPAFGTGCLKVTPAHDAKDYEIGLRHGLEVIDIFTPTAHLNELSGAYAGLSREEVRQKVVEDLRREGLLEREETYEHQIGHSERTDAVVEPRLSEQWFVRMRPLAELALKAVETGEIRLVPERFLSTYQHWLENVKDWCISRQLWWGHRIPAWYAPDGRVFVAETGEEAHAEARKTGYDPSTLVQDEDVLDTWFSSWLWPLSVFDFFEAPENPDFRYYYPTKVLVTAPEILFFWVARMIMAGYYFAGERPFEVVYLHGIVRDRLRRKMSKSLGNSPDPLDLIARYGADAVRMGIIMSAPAGNDLLFDESLCEQGQNFCNKLWNSFRLLRLWREKAESGEPTPFQQRAFAWFDKYLRALHREVVGLIEEYRFHEAMHALYRGVWDAFCNTYLEALKPGPPMALLEKVEWHALYLLRLLHPFMPYITEELWHEMTGAEEGRSLSWEQLPKVPPLQQEEKAELERVAYAQEVVRKLRGLMQSFPVLEGLRVRVVTQRLEWVEEAERWTRRFLPVEAWQVVASAAEGKGFRFLVGPDLYEVKISGDVMIWRDLRARLEKELVHVERFLSEIEGRLGNEKFLERASPDVIARERKKHQDTQERLRLLKEQLQLLSEV